MRITEVQIVNEETDRTDEVLRAVFKYSGIGIALLTVLGIAWGMVV